MGHDVDFGRVQRAGGFGTVSRGASRVVRAAAERTDRAAASSELSGAGLPPSSQPHAVPLFPARNAGLRGAETRRSPHAPSERLSPHGLRVLSGKMCVCGKRTLNTRQGQGTEQRARSSDASKARSHVVNQRKGRCWTEAVAREVPVQAEKVTAHSPDGQKRERLMKNARCRPRRGAVGPLPPPAEGRVRDSWKAVWRDL